MLPIGSLNFYAIPTLPADHTVPEDLVTEIGIFAGRLYMEYDEVNSLLGYVDRAKIHENSCTSITRTLDFLFEWTARRRKVQDFAHTPMGYICSGRVLERDHPFFGISAKERRSIAVLQRSVSNMSLDGVGEMDGDEVDIDEINDDDDDDEEG